MAQSEYVRRLRERVLVFDGAMGTQLMAREPTAEDFGGARFQGCNEALVLSRPDLIREIHEAYLAAGADVVETDSFMGSRLKLEEYGLGDRTVEINRGAAEIARAACDRFSTPQRPRFVAGSMGPTGMLVSSSDPVLSKITYEQLRDIYAEQARALVEGGADLLLLETMQDLLELKAAIAGIIAEFARGLRRVPIQAQPTLIQEGRMLLGTDIRAVTAVLDALEVDVVGLNCSTGPAQMRDSVRYLCENSRCFVAVVPNAGLPLMGPRGETIYPESPQELARELAAFVREFGVNAVGGCCGSTPEHVAAIRAGVDALGNENAGVRRAQSVIARVRDDTRPQWAASAMTAVALEQQPRPLIVGERINSQGSRRIKRLLLADDYDSIAQVAREQVEGGAHVLDVCCALTERADEGAQMRAVTRALAQAVEAPLMFDSTEPAVLETALQNYPGRAILNSVHLESGRAKIDAVLPLAIEHGSAVVALTIDEPGMAKTADRKLQVAQRIAEIAVGEYGLPPGALIFDALTFTLATGEDEFRRSAIETIEGIRAIKREIPSVLTSLGVSNVSFGLKPAARAALNSVFLHHCVEAGLDLALVHPKDITPYFELETDVREACDDLVFDRRADALARLIERFENVETQAGDAPGADDESAPVEERIHRAILLRRKDGIESKIDLALRERTPVSVLNDVLLPAMKDVGDRFGRGELILPFVLQSAEVMKKAVAHLEKFLDKTEGATKGTVVIATVFGDVHDIGKNLVNTILTNNGYTVVDLGKQVPMTTILDKAVEVEADAIGLSALLVSTSKQMPICVSEQDARGLRFPVIVGGAAINREFGRRIALLDGQRFFEPGLFYARDAFEGLELMDALTGAPEAREGLLERTKRDALAQRKSAAPRPVSAAAAPSAVKQTLADVPAPPFWGARTLDAIDLRELWPCFDLRSLFRLSWGAANTKGDAYDRLVRDDFEPRLRRYQERALHDRLLVPRVAYGYFPAAGDGDAVILYDVADRAREIARFEFPRQAGGERLSLADYLRAPTDGGASDVVALQVVTVGPNASARTQALQATGDYGESYFLHGFSVQSAEALAEYTHRRVRRELKLPDERGKRYSWGYGACPDVAQHATVFTLLDAPERIGVSLTEGFQIIPEQSTAAIVLHHPSASYFNAAATRELAQR
ncbi:MAG TPA: methionine synthase [Candidatus Tumulicola sp.]|nr:methionine synthase [Candidatus Tumulicola sp.]